MKTGCSSPSATTLPNPLFWSSLMVFHQVLFQSGGSNWGCDCKWLYCFGWDMSQNNSRAALTAVFLRWCQSQDLDLLLFPLSSINLSLSHQVRGIHTFTSNTDSSYLSSWLSLITAMHVVHGELFRVPLQSWYSSVVSENFNQNSWYKVCRLLFSHTCLPLNHMVLYAH